MANLISTFIDPQELASTIAGLGAASYISAIQLTQYFQSTVGGLGNSGYLSSVSSIQPTLNSTLIGLGTLGFLSTAGERLTINSTIQGLGTTGYISSLTGYVTNSNLNSTVTGLGTLGFLSTAGERLTINSTLQGLGTLGFLSTAGERLTINSTLQGLGTLGFLSTAGERVTINSSFTGLGTLGYASTTFVGNALSSFSTSIGLQFFTSSLTTSSMTVAAITFGSATGYLSMGDIVGTSISTLRLNASSINGNAPWQPSFLTSTVTGLGTIGYISSIQLTSSVIGIYTFINSFIDPVELTSTIVGLGTASYISAIQLTTNLNSTVRGLGTLGYLSSLTGYVTNSNINSTITGLGTSGYLSSVNLASYVTNSNINSTITGLGTSGYLSSAPITYLNSTMTGLGSLGYLSTAGERLTINSTIQGLGTFGFLSSVNLAGYVVTSNLNSTVAGLGTSGYLSTVQPTLNSTVSGLNSITTGATATATTNLNSTLKGLGTFGFLSSSTGGGITTTNLNSTIAGLGTFGFLSSISSIQPTLNSTLIGLGTLGFLSSCCSSGITVTELTSTIDNLTIPYSTLSLETAFQLYASSNELFFGTTYPPVSSSSTSAQIFIGDIHAKTGNSNNTEPIVLINQPPLANFMPEGYTIFTATGEDQYYTVPFGLSSMYVILFGAQGGNESNTNGGYGGYGDTIEGELLVTEGETLTIIVGSNGLANYLGVNYAVATYGGGAAADAGNNYFGGAGGGRSAIRRGGIELATAGGGGGSSLYANGGRGGYPSGYQGNLGSNASNAGGQTYGRNGNAGGGGSNNTGGQGGNDSGNGAGGNGSQFQGGSNNSSSSNIVGGGGGGGYYGGGGGTGGSNYAGAGGGGGSSYFGGLINGASVQSNGISASNTPSEPGGVAFYHDTIFPKRRNGNMLELRGYNGLSTILDGNTVTAVTSSNTMIQSPGIFIATVGTYIGGSGLLNSSDGGNNWSNVASNGFSDGAYGIAYNETMWVAGGDDVATIKYSYDGIYWNDASANIGYVYGVAWGNNMWLAFGYSDSGTYGTTIKYSYDGITWNDVTSGSFPTDTPFGGYWNGKMWVAVGSHSDGGAGIKYSYDGLIWNTATYHDAKTGGNQQTSVTWNGSIWVSNGSFFLYSHDGINWYDCNYTDNGPGWAVAWNGHMFLTGFNDTTTYVSLQYSYDGINWYEWGILNGLHTVFGITWNGSLWVISSAYGGSDVINLYYSSDGFTWTLANNWPGGIALASYNPVTIAYNLSITPIYLQKTLSVVSADKGYYPLLNTQINQVTFSQSTITLDNTKLGINRTPYFTFDVNGSANFSSIVAGFYDNSNGTAIPDYLLSLMSGDAYKPTGTSWNVASDKRIKENIVDADLTRCYDDLKHLSLRRFNYISSFSDQVKLYDNNVTGFIAQEIISTIPKAVKQMSAYGYSDFKTINLDQITMTSFGAIKKLITDKESLESTVFTLQTMNDTLQVRLSTLEGIVSSKL